MTDTIKNVFISHIHEDDDRIADLVRLIEQQGYVVRNGSITSDKPNDAQNDRYIKSGILAPRINWAGTMIVLISPETKESHYVDWEIEYAEGKSKRVIGVWDWGAKGVDIPEALEKYHGAVVGWNGSAIADAIEGRINTYYSPDGELKPERQIVRYDCGQR